MLQLGDRVGRPRMLLAAHAPGVLAAGVEHVLEDRIVLVERVAVDADRLLGDVEEADALDVGGGAGEVLVDQRARETHRLEHLRAGVGHVGRDAHLGHHLLQPLADRLDVVLDRLGAVIASVEVGKRGSRAPGTDAPPPRRSRRAARNGAPRARCRSRPRGRCEVRKPLPTRCWWIADSASSAGIATRVAVDLAIGDDDDRVARAHRVLGLRGERGEPRLDRLLAPGDRVGDVELAGLELAAGVALDVPDLLHLVEVEHRLADLQAQRRIRARRCRAGWAWGR